MLKIDAHHHFWKYEAAEYGWIDEHMSVLRRDFLPGDLRRQLDANGISGAISVQARQTVEETRWLLELAEAHDFLRGVVGWVPLTDARVGATLERFAQHPKLRGVRHVLQDEQDENYILRPDFQRGVGELKQFGLTYDILIFERHLPQTISFVDRFPNQIFVVDHLAKPRVKYKAMSPWREQMRELAKRPHVYCKMSGLATEAQHNNWTAAQLIPYMETVLELFGPRRVMFGSDWPVCLLAIAYERWVALVEKVAGTLSLDEQEAIWSGSARAAYGLK